MSNPPRLDPLPSTLRQALIQALDAACSRPDDDPVDEGRRCAVWAAVVDAGARVSLGRTVVSTSLGLGTCATRVALARRIADGHDEPIAVAFVPAADGNAKSVGSLLCGLCRQTLLELAPGASLHVAVGSELQPAAMSVAALLPDAFHEFHGS